MCAFNAAKNMGVNYNVTFRVIDKGTNKVVSEHIGHNQATDTLITGIAHYLRGDGVLNQGGYMLSSYIPKYISLGTMGLINQEEEPGTGLPLMNESECTSYMQSCPGYGADGSEYAYNNGRTYYGLGPNYSDRGNFNIPLNCELVSPTFRRSPITYRHILPEEEAERPKTCDVVFSAMISTGALAQFRGEDKDYIFISECGLWADDRILSKDEVDPRGGAIRNSLLAAYRIVPPDARNYDMSDENNRNILKQNILKVGRNQVVQVIWKIQIGAINDVISGGGEDALLPDAEDFLYPGAVKPEI